MGTLSSPVLHRVCGAALAAVLAGHGPGSAADAPVASPGQSSAAQAAGSTRAPDAAERAAMLEILKGEAAPERAAWFSHSAGNAESAALADALAALFREAGWQVHSRALTGMVLKPGVSVLLAEEQPPAWAETALRAMQASGIEVKSASGYRSYYDEKKAENAAWPGVPLEKDAALVIVVGPAPQS